MDWITEATRRVARACALDADALAIDERTAETLLDIAAVAARSSGERTNAPLLCHVLGRAVSSGASLDDAVRAVREYASET